MRTKCLIGILLFAIGGHFNARAQLPLLQRQLLKLTYHSDSIINHSAPEKLYIQFDKPEYAAGDTIWFKAYVFNAASHLLSSRSGLLHVDIATDSNRVIKQYLFAVDNGLCPGNIAIAEKDFKPGNYVVRTYTQWMRNFSQDIYYYKRIRIAGIGENAWLINSRIDTSANGTHIRARLQFSRADKVPMGDSTFQAEVLNGKKGLYKQKVQADKNGLLDVSFAMPVNGKPAIIVENSLKDKRAVVPIMLNRPQNTDIQFMPEGGSLVIGLSSRIGFKAISEDGKGADISGVVVDRAGKQVSDFRSVYKGMGSFELQPQAGEQYIARVTLPGGLVKDYTLPLPKTSGISLRVNNTMQSDSVEIELRATSDVLQTNQSYFLLAKDRGVICYAAVINFQKNSVITRMISRNHFPTGIVHFILMTMEGQPLNERLIYVDQKDELNIKVESAPGTYAPKDSIALHLNVTDKDGKPVAGFFSMAVTDDTQVKSDSLNDENILSSVLLTSDIKGYVETPGYYLRRNEKCLKALDDLLLTQGWVSYEPTDAGISYQPEKEYAVTGRVNNVFNSPVKKTDVLLFSSHPSIMMDTLTDEQGRFNFNHFPRVDTLVFVLQARNRHGRSFNVSVVVDEMPPPPFLAPKAAAITPWYVNSDTTLLTRVKGNIAINKFRDDMPGAHHLKEVKIIAHKTVKGSENLNGPGNADIVLDEKDVEAAGKKSWLQMLEETISGFHEGSFCVGKSPKCAHDTQLLRFVIDKTDGMLPPMSQQWYFVKDKPVKIIIDGVPLYKVIPLGNEPVVFTGFSDFLKSHSAEDIKGIEINTSTKYTYRYVPMEWSETIQMNEVAFIEITTRSSHGAVLKSTPGTYLYKPLALSWPKQFYKPRYAVNDTTKKIDLRPTIDWEPNIITGSDGKATVSFYAGTEPTDYTLIVEGTDDNGNLGSQRKKIRIIRNKETSKSK